MRSLFSPLFNRYTGGQSFDTHVDNSIRQITGTPHRIRADIWATLFSPVRRNPRKVNCVLKTLTDSKKAKLPAGHVVLYPATSLRDDGWRSISFDLDLGIQRLNRELPNHAAAVQFTGVYHNLLRQWAGV